METLIIIVSGVLVTISVYLLLSNNMIRIILGTAILTHAVHLLLMAMGGFKGENVPILNGTSGSYVDSLPQALILTSIVINFAVTAFFLVLSYHAYQKLHTDDLRDMRRYFYE